MSLPEQIQVAIFFWVSPICIFTLLRVAHLGLNANCLLTMTTEIQRYLLILELDSLSPEILFFNRSFQIPFYIDSAASSRSI